MTDTPNTIAFDIAVHADRVAFGPDVLFEALDFTLSGGGWTCLLGASGVGKSTLLRLIAGLAPEAATVRVACADGQPLRGRAAYMAQQDLLLPWLSVIDNVCLGARLRGDDHHSPALRTRATELLKRVGLKDAADALPATLSGGMRQRAALVRTLIEDRPVVLMDEPFSALDAITRVRLQNLAAELLAGRTVLLVTHDPMEALRLGDRIHVLSGRPAKIDEALEPSGDRPRAIDDPQLLESQAHLLARLSAADEEPVAA